MPGMLEKSEIPTATLNNNRRQNRRIDKQIILILPYQHLPQRDSSSTAKRFFFFTCSTRVLDVIRM